MADMQPTAHTLTLTPQRLESARKWLRANEPKLRTISAEAMVVATIGLLICDSRGHVPEAALASAVADESAVSAAKVLLKSVLC